MLCPREGPLESQVSSVCWSTHLPLLSIPPPAHTAVSGQDIFPLYNNRAELTPDACEVDSCNEHIGGGGGQPHLHGDPFGTSCLYSAANYSSLSAHPPQVRPACYVCLLPTIACLQPRS